MANTYTPITEIDWPDSLPDRPLISQYQEQFTHTMIESSIDLGPRTRRRRISKNVNKLICTYLLDYGQVETLKQFYEQTTYGGTLSFNFKHPRTGVPVIVRFSTDPIVITPAAYQKYKVTVLFEQLPWQSQELFIPDANENKYEKNSDYYTTIVWQGPVAWFYSGTYRRIWFVHYFNISSKQSNWLGYYDLDSNSFSDLLDLLSPNSTGTDNHHMASLVLSNDGYILFCYDNIDSSHNKGIIIKRSTNPEDRSAFGIVYDGTISGRNIFQGYPTMWKRSSDGRIFMIWRGNITSVGEYHNCLVYSDDNGVTWGTEKIIVEEVQGVVTDPVNYYIISNGSEKWVGLLIIVRNGSSGKMKYAYFVKSADGITWQNLEGTFSKNIETQGYITSDEVKNNCAIDTTLSETSNDYLSPIAIACTDDGDFYIVWQRLIWNGSTYDFNVQFISYVNGVRKQFEITSVWTSRGHTSGGQNIALIAYSAGILDMFLKIRDGATGYDVIKVLRTYDAGENWEEIRQVYDYADAVAIGYLRPAANTFEAEKSLVCFSVKTIADGKHDPNQLVLRR